MVCHIFSLYVFLVFVRYHCQYKLPDAGFGVYAIDVQLIGLAVKIS